MSDRVLQVLEETARTRLSRLQPTPDPVGRTTAAVERSRARRRNGAVVATVMSVVLVLTLALTVVPQLTADRRPPAGPDPVFPEVVRTVQLAGHTWPVAGRLARDPDFVADAERRVQQLAIETPRAGCLGTPGRALFADDLQHLRVVVVVNGRGCWWVAVAAAGASAAELGLREPAGFMSATRAGVAVTVPGPGGSEALLVIAPEDATAEVATRPEAWPTLQRTYSPLPLRQGATVASLTTERGRTVNPAWLSVRTRTGSDLPVEVVAASVFDRTAEASYDVSLPFLQDLPDGLFSAGRRAVDLAIQHGALREDGGLTFSAAAWTTGSRGWPDALVVVDAVQDGIRSRALSSGRLRDQEQVLLSDASRQDPRPVVGWAWSSVQACVAWLPVGRRLTYSSGVTGHHSVEADERGFVHGLPCGEGLVLETVSDDEGTVLWIADAGDRRVQP